MYKSNSSDNVTLIYPSGSAKGEYEANITAEDNYWVPNMCAYPTNMTMTAVVELDNMELNGEQYELAAFAADGECRGSIRLMEVDGRYVAFMTITGEEATDLQFGLYNAETGETHLYAEEALSFETNATVGELDEPFVLHFRGGTGIEENLMSLNLFPNPVERGARFTLGVKTETNEPVRVEIINALGSVVAVEVSTTLPSTLVAPRVTGVYTVRIITSSKHTYCKKLIVR